jgi:hypothetical protein
VPARDFALKGAIVRRGCAIVLLLASYGCPAEPHAGPSAPAPDACGAIGPCTDPHDAADDVSESEAESLDAASDVPPVDVPLADVPSEDNFEASADAGTTDVSEAEGDALNGDSADASDSLDEVDGSTRCDDAQRDGTETDIDCGGTQCAPCEVNQTCVLDSDCKTHNCAGARCALASGPPDWLKVKDAPIAGALVGAVMTYGTRAGTMVVMSAGGIYATPTDYATFDFAAGTWSKASLPAARSGQSMTADLQGRVYAVGGNVDEIWMYDGTWKTSLAAQHVRRPDMAVATGTDGLIYAMGGTAAANSTNVVEAYDPQLDTWTTLANAMPTARANLAAAVLRNQIYAIGGRGTSASLPYYVSSVEAYDVGARAWTPRRALPQTLAYCAAAAAPDGRIYVAGGSPAFGVLSATANVVAYDRDSDRWTPVRPLAKARSSVSAVVAPDGRIYVIGDLNSAASPVEVYGPVVALNPTHAARGATVLVTGSNFAASATVNVYLGSAAMGTLVRKGATTSAGALLPPITFTVPDAPSGDTVVTVVDDRSRYPITLLFTVD